MQELFNDYPIGTPFLEKCPYPRRITLLEIIKNRNELWKEYKEDRIKGVF